MTTLTTPTLTIQELQAKAATKAAQIAAQAKEAAKKAVLEATISLYESETYQNALTTEAKKELVINSLERKIETCKQVIVQTPVHDKVTRQDKQWNGRPTYGLGKDIELLHTLASGILYATTQHKTLMLEAAPVNPNTMELFLTALGTVAYYSPKRNAIIPAVPYNAEVAVQAATLLGAQLGLVLDTSLLTKETMSERFNKARLRAEEQEAEASLVPQDTHFTMQ